jgi:uncharacterized membrane protein
MQLKLRSGAAVLGLSLILSLIVPLASAAAPPAAPQSPPGEELRDEYVRGRTLEVVKEEQREVAGYPQLLQHVRVRLLSGSEGGQVVDAEYSAPAGPSQTPPLRAGERVVLAKSAVGPQAVYFVVDRFRLPSLGAILLLFFLLAALFSRIRGVTSVLGLAVSVLILARFVVPSILGGRDPLLVSLMGAVAIALSSIYLAHGFSRRTSVALVSTLVTLGIAAAMSLVFVSLTNLFGGGTEEAFYLQMGVAEELNLRGLLLGGILLGALGVLDDITTSQAAAVDEIKHANRDLGFGELYRRGLSVGREHIAALVNTLVLAYAGASLPLFLIFSLELDQPLWVTLNSEFVAEEVVRSLVGSIALILAVPITTGLAAWRLSGATEGHHGHRH